MVTQRLKGTSVPVKVSNVEEERTTVADQDEADLSQDEELQYCFEYVARAMGVKTDTVKRDVVGPCFVCGEKGHLSRECPYKDEVQKAVDEEKKKKASLVGRERRR